MAKYEWQGEPVKVEFGYCEVIENKEKPLFWYNFECNWDAYLNKERRSVECNRSALIPAVKITSQGGDEFCISNHFGIGVHKLTNGGWPSYSHFSLPIDGFNSKITKVEQFIYCVREFDLESYESYESKRREWQKRTLPEAYKEYELLREVLLNKSPNHDR